MPKLVVLGAKLRCDQGLAPSSLTVLPPRPTVGVPPMAAATVNDFVPMMNVAPFGMCKTQANPQVTAATAAAQGVLTPQPCIPVLTAPWSSGAANATYAGAKLLTDDSTCTCQWTGQVSITDPGTSIDVD